MKQLVVISGKGGTGKTSIVASLAHLAKEDLGEIVCADCDVDAADLALVLAGDDGEAEPFFAGRRAVIDEERCVDCGLCEEHCRFDAIEVMPSTRVRTLHCEGCGVCAQVCPEQAVRFVDDQAGWILQRDAATGPLVHGRLGVAQDNSGKLVAAVRERARAAGADGGAPLVLVDGPPGIGCPVHAALTGCDWAMVVTEPSAAGEHDLRRVLELCEHFRMHAAVIINKHDLAPQLATRIETMARQYGAPLLGRIPFQPGVPRALARGELPLVVDSFRQSLSSAWRRMLRLLELPIPRADGGDGRTLVVSREPTEIAREARPPAEASPAAPKGSRLERLAHAARRAFDALEVVASVLEAAADRSDAPPRRARAGQGAGARRGGGGRGAGRGPGAGGGGRRRRAGRGRGPNGRGRRGGRGG